MANPQKENGHTQVANEILEALAKQKISGQEWQVIITLLRKTYGFNKKEDWISLSQFAEATDLNVQRVCEALRGLEVKGIVTKKRNGRLISVGLDKDHEKWTSLRKSVTLRKNVKTITQKRNSSLRKNVDTKETITKETITKETEVEPRPDKRNSEIDNMLNALKTTIGIDAFVDSRIERNMAKHCLNLMEKITPDEFRRRLEILLSEPFIAKNCNKIKFIYNNIKGFIEPRSNTVII